ncbi:MAG: alpha/beta hydrolase [Bryobacteraceae bacterium]
MRAFLPPLLVAALALAETKVETGEINGARFRIDLPESWNGSLVMYTHGYSASPGNFTNPKLSPVLETFVKEGYAVAQSGYSAGGWAIQEAVNDTEALRRYVVAKHGKPKETYITGHSMGGFLTMMLMEVFPNVYDGGLALCGPLAPASLFFHRNLFDQLVVFEYLFPGVLPPPVNLPSGYAMRAALSAEAEKAISAIEGKAAVMRRMAGIRTNKELASTMVFFTYILKELQERAGGNAFDNRSAIYQGSNDDNALNDSVKRYAADARAVDYVRRWYTPTGRLSRNMLAIHTTYDPLIPAWIPNSYVKIAEEAGREALFHQQYVKRGGHCAISPAETAAGFAALKEWKRTGKRPPPDATSASSP